MLSNTNRLMATMTEHPALDELEAYILNPASAEVAERLEGHLLFCEQCQDEAYLVEFDVAVVRAAFKLVDADLRCPADRASSKRRCHKLFLKPKKIAVLAIKP
jgi:hypothetical protein